MSYSCSCNLSKHKVIITMIQAIHKKLKLIVFLKEILVITNSDETKFVLIELIG